MSKRAADVDDDSPATPKSKTKPASANPKKSKKKGSPPIKTTEAPVETSPSPSRSPTITLPPIGSRTTMKPDEWAAKELDIMTRFDAVIRSWIKIIQDPRYMIDGKIHRPGRFYIMQEYYALYVMQHYKRELYDPYGRVGRYNERPRQRLNRTKFMAKRAADDEEDDDDAGEKKKSKPKKSKKKSKSSSMTTTSAPPETTKPPGDKTTTTTMAPTTSTTMKPPSIPDVWTPTDIVNMEDELTDKIEAIIFEWSHHLRVGRDPKGRNMDFLDQVDRDFHFMVNLHHKNNPRRAGNFLGRRNQRRPLTVNMDEIY